MDKLGELKGMQALVYDILIDDEPARDDDKVLYLKVLARECESIGKDFSKVSLREWLTDNTNYPNYDSVTRARRKVQELYPEVRGSHIVTRYRDSLTRHYRTFAREKK